MQYLQLFKLIHIIGFVSWMAGLFYLGRMFVHHVEALSKPQPDRDILSAQFVKMENLVWRIILNPAHILTWVAGSAMLFINPNYFTQGWFHLKFTLVILLTGYHHMCRKPMRKLAAGEMPMTSFKFRMWNEVPTVFLVAISTLGVYQMNINYGYWALSLLIFCGLIYYGARAYQKRRDAGA